MIEPPQLNLDPSFLIWMNVTHGRYVGSFMINLLAFGFSFLCLLNLIADRPKISLFFCTKLFGSRRFFPLPQTHLFLEALPPIIYKWLYKGMKIWILHWNFLMTFRFPSLFFYSIIYRKCVRYFLAFLVLHLSNLFSSLNHQKGED